MMMTKSLLPSSLLSGDAGSGFLPLSAPKIGRVLPRESPGNPPDSPGAPLPGVAVPSYAFEPAPECWPATVPLGYFAACPVPSAALAPTEGVAGFPVESGLPAEAIGTSAGFVVIGTNVGGFTEIPASTPRKDGLPVGGGARKGIPISEEPGGGGCEMGAP